MPISEKRRKAEEGEGVRLLVREINKKQRKLEKGVRLIVDHWGNAYLSGIRNDFAKYEKDIFKGNIPCPFKLEFKDRHGKIVSTQPIPLTPNGTPRIDLFGVK